MAAFATLQPADLDELPEFYRRYANRVKEYNLLAALDYSLNEALRTFEGITRQQEQFRYQPGKWTVKEVICHLLDAERIFCYRALRFARHDTTPLEGFNEEAYAPESNAASRNLSGLIGETETLRHSTRYLFDGFSLEMLSRKGIANGVTISVKSTGFLIAGHMMHHLSVLTERYGIRPR